MKVISVRNNKINVTNYELEYVNTIQVQMNIDFGWHDMANAGNILATMHNNRCIFLPEENISLVNVSIMNNPDVHEINHVKLQFLADIQPRADN